MCDGMVLLPGFADSDSVKRDIDAVVAEAPLRHMETMRGFTMSVAMTNCGALGWVSDRRGYRYSPIDPASGLPWPQMPAGLRTLSAAAAEIAGYKGFAPDACLINQYQPGAQMGAHQDRNERSFAHPIVSVSIGIPARFFVIGPEKRGPSKPVDLQDGDVLVFGGEARSHYHGVRKLKPNTHPGLGAFRWNLTFRVAG